MQNSKFIWVVLVVVVAAAFAGFIWLQKPIGGGGGEATTTRNGVTGTGDFTVSADTMADLTIPDFDKPIAYASTVEADVRAAINANLTIAQGKIRADAFDLASWLELGRLKKAGGDYAGAEEAWKFVSEASPQNPVAYFNLGDLYMNFIQDYKKAEAAFESAVKNAPAETQAYRELYSLYSNFYKKGTGEAEAALKKGIAAVPDTVELRLLLARYYKAGGRTSAANAQYEAAIAAAEHTEQPVLAAQIRAEMGE